MYILLVHIYIGKGCGQVHTVLLPSFSLKNGHEIKMMESHFQSDVPTHKPSKYANLNKLESLIYWRHPQRSAKYFTATLFTLIFFKMINPVTFFLKIGYTVLFITSLLEFITSLTLGKGIMTQMAPQVCPDMVRYKEPRVNSILDTIPPLQQGLRRLVFAHEPKRTIEYGVLFFIMHKVGKFVSLWAMCFMGVFFLFTVPFILKIFEKDIDVAVNHGVEFTKRTTKEFTNEAGEKSKVYLEKLGSPLSNLVGKNDHSDLRPEGIESLNSELEHELETH